MNKSKKTKKLHSFQLFYEEVPYKVSASGRQKGVKRIKRKSKTKQNNVFDD